jgi:flavorubredoxin
MTTIAEISEGLYRISTPIAVAPGGFSFNQYLLVDEKPLLFHTGPRGLFTATAAAIGKVMPLERLRYVAFSHFESDECGALNDFLRHAPGAEPVCSQINAMINADSFDRPPLALADGATLRLGRRTVRWLDTPHLPHAWECGYLFEETSATLFAGDLFTQPGEGRMPLTTDDILGPSEAFRREADYYAHSPQTGALLDKLIATRPKLLACMHGSAWTGDGATLLAELKSALSAPR